MDPSASRQRDVRLIVGAVGISALGDFLLWVPLTLHLQEMSDSSLAIAGLFLALWTPVVVLAPVAGLVVDRLEARGILLVTGFAFAQPAEFSLVPVVAGGERLTEVNGLVETARYAGMTAGPLIGGVLAGFGGTRVAMLVNAATFGVVALAALRLA